MFIVELSQKIIHNSIVERRCVVQYIFIQTIKVIANIYVHQFSQTMFTFLTYHCMQGMKNTYKSLSKSRSMH